MISVHSNFGHKGERCIEWGPLLAFSTICKGPLTCTLFLMAVTLCSTFLCLSETEELCKDFSRGPWKKFWNFNILKNIFLYGPFLKSLLNLLQYCSCFFFFFPLMFWPTGCKAYGIFAPWPGIKPAPPCTGRQRLNHWTASKIHETSTYWWNRLMMNVVYVIYFELRSGSVWYEMLYSPHCKKNILRISLNL